MNTVYMLRHIIYYGNCYFRRCKISRTTLTTTSNTYVDMSTTNSNSTTSGLVDRTTSGDNTYADDCYDASVSLNNMTSGYVWDQASATFNNRDYPLPL